MSQPEDTVYQPARAARRPARKGPTPMLLAKPDWPRLVSALQEKHDVIAPVYHSSAIMLGKISSPDEIAVGYRDEQQAGHYQVEKAPNGNYFGYNNGEESPKWFLFPSRLQLFSGEQQADGSFNVTQEPGIPRPLAFFGIRPCDAFAILVYDKTMLQNPNVDQPYKRRRDGSFVATINCTTPGNTCFCASMGTGPKAEVGYDLRLTELRGGFLVEAGTPAGSAILGKLPTRSADSAALEEANSLLGYAASHMGRKLNTDNLPQILRDRLEHPHWDIMKTWCVGCTNCTIVCPTCFCNNTQDHIDLNLQKVSRERVWDSCFAWQFTEMHYCNPRAELKFRYRHWAEHKLSYWVEQYGVFGCVGCGRCITWCPVGIDITEVAAAVRGERQREAGV